MQALPRSPLVASATKRHQQVMLDSQALLLRAVRGSAFQGIPLRRTNRMPFSPARSGTGFRRRIAGCDAGVSGVAVLL